MVATHFSGNAIKIGVLEDFEKPDFLEKKWWNYFLPVFKAPPKLGVTFFWAFFLPFSVSSASSKRVCQKKTYFIGFLHTLLKHLVTSCSNNQLNLNSPKKGAQFFFGNPIFDQIFAKNTNFAPPPENCAQKISQNPYFYRLKKRWPSY